jgi:hypothetical protein
MPDCGSPVQMAGVYCLNKIAVEDIEDVVRGECLA